MKKMVLSACFISIVISIADSVKPGERFNKQIKLLFSILLLLGLIAPFAAGNIEFNIPVYGSFENNENYENIKEAADEQLKESAQQSIINSVEGILMQNGINYKKITASVNINDNNSIDIIEIGCQSSDFEAASELIKNHLGYEIKVSKIEYD